MGHAPVKGAYTELFAGFSPEITAGDSSYWGKNCSTSPNINSVTLTNCQVIPWGRISTIREDIRNSGIPESEGGSGLGARFWDWCEAEVKVYLKE